MSNFIISYVVSGAQVAGSSTPMLVLMTEIYRKEGLAALYSGLGNRERAETFMSTRAVDPHSFFADPDPAFFSMRIRIQRFFLCGSGSRLKDFGKKVPYEEFCR